jgi:DNA-binding NarL/FixJ family response regulator
VRVAIVNDFELVVRGLETMLVPFRHEIVVLERDVRERPRQRVDVALFDTYGQPGGGLERVRALAADSHIGSVAVYAWQLGRAHVDAVRAAGARGVLDKALTGADLAQALLAIARGEIVVSPTFHRATAESWPGHEFGLTVRESEVASLLLQGLANREIAAAMHISEHTVKTHLKGIFNKTGTRSRGQVVARIAAHAEFRRITSS